MWYLNVRVVIRTWFYYNNNDISFFKKCLLINKGCEFMNKVHFISVYGAVCGLRGSQCLVPGMSRTFTREIPQATPTGD